VMPRMRRSQTGACTAALEPEFAALTPKSVELMNALVQRFYAGGKGTWPSQQWRQSRFVRTCVDSRPQLHVAAPQNTSSFEIAVKHIPHLTQQATS